MHPRTQEFAGNPFLVFGPQPRREQRLRAYIVREHRSGRRLSEIMDDPHLALLGGRSIVWKALLGTGTMSALGRDTVADIRGSISSIPGTDHNAS